jgi:hypothetical protein
MFKRKTKMTNDPDAVHLTPEEHLAGRNRIRQHMEQHPAVLKAAVPSRPSRRRVPFQQWFRPLMTRSALVLSLVLAVTLAVAGVSFAAEDAIPGDMLYPVKVSVNEEVRAALTPTAEAKAAWDAARAERRLHEAAQLVAEARFDDAAKARIEDAFFEHAERVKDRIAEFEADENIAAAADVATDFETSLSAHQAILARLSASADIDARANISDFIHEITEEKRVAEEKRAAFDVTIHEGRDAAVRQAAASRMRAAERRIGNVKKLLQKNRGALGNAEVGLMAQLDSAQAAYVKAKTDYDAGESANALILFQTAQRIAQESGLLIRAHGDLKLDFGASSEADGATKKDDGETRTEGIEESVDAESHAKEDEHASVPSRERPSVKEEEASTALDVRVDLRGSVSGSEVRNRTRPSVIPELR